MQAVGALIAAARRKMVRAARFATFRDMLIERKFLIFSCSVAAWLVLIAAVGLIAAESAASRWIIFYLTITAVILLVFFAYWFSRSLTRPLEAMKEQIDALAGGEADLGRRVSVDTKDEIGMLSESFNRLLDTVRDMNTFKKVIEEDDLPEDVYRRLGRTFESLGLASYRIYEVSNSRNAMRVAHASADPDEDVCSRDVFVNCNLCRAKKTGEVVASESYPDICKHFLRAGSLNHVCVPMIVGDSTGGVVQFLYAEGVPAEGTAQMQRLVKRARKYVQEALPVLEAKRLMGTLRESSLRDHMTGLYNRRFLEEYCETLVATVLRRGTVLGLLMCDLDFFKEVNDTYGHSVGDTVLKATSDIISQSVRTSDIVVRYGGEEFLVLLQDMKEDDAAVVAEKIRRKVEETRVKIGGGFIQKTISIGISEFPKDTNNFWQAVKYSDVSLYRAKDGGRNRVVRFQPEMWTSEEY